MFICMNLETFFFYLFSFFALLSSLIVIISSNAIYSVLFLILTFINITFLLLMMGAEFFSFLLLIVYVGAIAVIFLFVIMMLNLKLTKLKLDFYFYLPIIFFLVIFFGDFLLANFFFDSLNKFDNKNNLTLWIQESFFFNNIQIIGSNLYTFYGFLFIIAGLILLVSMIGVILLTMHQKQNVKKQKIELQLIKNSKKILKFCYLR